MSTLGQLISLNRPNIPAMFILHPEQAESRLTHQKFRLLDRVMIIKHPLLGHKATVVGVNDMIDVVLDKEYANASDLNGNCSKYKGISFTNFEIINLTMQQPFKKHVNAKWKQDDIAHVNEFKKDLKKHQYKAIHSNKVKEGITYSKVIEKPKSMSNEDKNLEIKKLLNIKDVAPAQKSTNPGTESKEDALKKILGITKE
eukprot:NODE_763_length_4099_cov_0.613500.p3 type:complete len:200 gc:universal NODE_763_length_4099_cov_0.613500:2629-3228(+)